MIDDTPEGMMTFAEWFESTKDGRVRKIVDLPFLYECYKNGIELTPEGEEHLNGTFSLDMKEEIDYIKKGSK